MKKIVSRSLMFWSYLLLYSFVNAQPSGTQYVTQPDFGDQQNTNYPTATMQWTFLQNWNNVNATGPLTNWIGPGYAPYGQSQTHPFYIVLDDTGDDYGAVAGRISNLEYRLVRCNFSYRVFNEVEPDNPSKIGDLFILLGNSELDFPAFDPGNPQDFEDSGHGQVLFNFVVPPSVPDSVGGTWATLAATVQNIEQREAYAINASTNGAVGNPFTHVGIIWVSDFAESRIMIDDFTLTDICPDCQLKTVLSTTGCFANTWATPIPNNYYYYSAEIREFGTTNVIFREVHQPARFNWDGIGNQSGWNGVLVPENLSLRATISYYSCLSSSANVVTRDFTVERQSTCTDTAFGSAKTSPSMDYLQIFPNPLGQNRMLQVQSSSLIGKSAAIRIRNTYGMLIVELGQQKFSQYGKIFLNLSALVQGTYFLEIESSGTRTFRKITIH
jgi:hypothetical protein